mmetsp:Transcript_22150/g.41292  ORF Transcript_22150/g.41292 Transcript_22150/m.41292 type:complete len:220 (-) Transcript_22150:716-1375(-)
MSPPRQAPLRQVQAQGPRRLPRRGPHLRHVPVPHRQQAQEVQPLPRRQVRQSIGPARRLVRRRGLRRPPHVRRVPQGQERHLGRTRTGQGRGQRRLHPHRRGRGRTAAPPSPRPRGLLLRHLRLRTSEPGIHVALGTLGAGDRAPRRLPSVPDVRGQARVRRARAARHAPEAEGRAHGPDAQLRGMSLRRAAERHGRQDRERVRPVGRPLDGAAQGDAE